VRHATVSADTAGIIRGTLNSGLDDQGEAEAADLADLFEDKPVSAVYSDDLKRTYHTAISIAHCKGLEVVQDPDLRSWDVGPDLEGRSISANEDEIRELKLQPDRIPVGGQSWGDFEVQTIAAFNRYLSKAMAADAPIVLVIHGSGIQVIWDYIGALDKNPAYDATPLENAGVAAISMSRNGYRVKVLQGAKEMADA
jgi:broad specificity phosphatase PhoE